MSLGSHTRTLSLVVPVHNIILILTLHFAEWHVVRTRHSSVTRLHLGRTKWHSVTATATATSAEQPPVLVYSQNCRMHVSTLRKSFTSDPIGLYKEHCDEHTAILRGDVFEAAKPLAAEYTSIASPLEREWLSQGFIWG
jgi:hypothetical protein